MHSDEINIVDLNDEFIDALELQRGNQYFLMNSSKNGKLIVQHHPTHLFAVSLLGTKKADSLYLKALKNTNILLKK